MAEDVPDEDDFDWEGGVVRLTVHYAPLAFRCGVCDLRLDGQEELGFVGLAQMSSTRKKSTRSNTTTISIKTNRPRIRDDTNQARKIVQLLCNFLSKPSFLRPKAKKGLSLRSPYYSYSC